MHPIPTATTSTAYNHSPHLTLAFQLLLPLFRVLAPTRLLFRVVLNPPCQPVPNVTFKLLL